MKHLFVTDMDGTLLGRDSRVSSRSAEIISRLSKSGVPVTVATARTPATVEMLLEDTYINIPAIVMTGAAMWDRVSQRYMDVMYPEADAAWRVMCCCREHGVNPFVYVLRDDTMLEVYHNGRMNSREWKFYEERCGLTRKRFIFDDPHAYEEPLAGTVLIFAVGEGRAIESVAAELMADGRLSVSSYRDIFNPDVAYLEVFAAGVSKAAAIGKLARQIGADTVTVYGDNLNDLSMFAVADDAVAVDNAMPGVMEKADRRIGANYEDAVALDMAMCARAEGFRV
ncbi:HAD hydrolase family protein [Duncaniella muris]|uniref:HAD hydrolase family protein n=1 Tax=Duncaniella muris TaxID=2094150 RepID=UPI00136D7F6C|nr:HAD family hydrolase [Duncaniella muris]NBH91042.1 HAD family phosphatase [Muribaculaceae bacterium S4]NBI19367.1 HAD family phosphatase [Muribaculaceae bacterium Z1]